MIAPTDTAQPRDTRPETVRHKQLLVATLIAGARHMSAKKPSGRPATDWTDELIDALCTRVESGQGIEEACAEGGLPHFATVYRKMAKDPAFASRIARAREAQQDHEADYMVKLADHATPEDVQVVKLQIWARQWRAAKLAPKKYGEKIGVEHSGEVRAHMTLEQFRERVAKARVNRA